MIGSGKIVTDGLVYSVDASDRNSYPGSGTSWNDLVHQNHGTLSVVAGANLPTFVSDGTAGNYFDFDGSNDTNTGHQRYVEIGNAAEIKQALNQTFSICFWARPVYAGLYRCVFGWMNGDNTAGGGIEFVNNTRKFKMWVADDNNFEGPECTSDATDNVWCQIVGTSDGSTLRIYFNGVEEDTESKGGCGDITAAGNVRLGCHAGLLQSGRFWNGGIGCVQVYNRTLSALEVTQNFETQRTRFGV